MSRRCLDKLETLLQAWSCVCRDLKRWAGWFVNGRIWPESVWLLDSSSRVKSSWFTDGFLGSVRLSGAFPPVDLRAVCLVRAMMWQTVWANLLTGIAAKPQRPSGTTLFLGGRWMRLFRASSLNGLRRLVGMCSFCNKKPAKGRLLGVWTIPLVLVCTIGLVCTIVLVCTIGLVQTIGSFWTTGLVCTNGLVRTIGLCCTWYN